jgi:hypothetical protein
VGTLGDHRVEAYWLSYLQSLPPDAPVRDEHYVAEGWGDSPQMADELGALIAAGTKTATCSTLWEYEAAGERLPEAGLKTIVLDGNGDPLCIVETTERSRCGLSRRSMPGSPTKRERGLVRWNIGGRRTGASSPACCRT